MVKENEQIKNRLSKIQGSEDEDQQLLAQVNDIKNNALKALKNS